MAATTNLMSVNVPTAGSTAKVRTASSTLQRQQISQKYQNGNMNEARNFDRNFERVFDKASAVQSSKDTYDQSIEAVKDKNDPISAAITTSAQGQSKKNTQDAPQKTSQSTNESVEVDDIDENDEVNTSSQTTSSIFMMDLLSFTESNADILGENLVKTGNLAKTNLMTILPQSQEAGEKSQSMLNLLSGRTWQEPNGSESAATTNVIDNKLSTGSINLNVVQSTEEVPQILTQQTTAQQLNFVSLPTELTTPNNEEQTAISQNAENGLLSVLNDSESTPVIQTLQAMNQHQSESTEQVLPNKQPKSVLMTQPVAANVNDLQAAAEQPIEQTIFNSGQTQNNQQVQPQQIEAGQQNAQPTVDVPNQQGMLTNTQEAQPVSTNQPIINTTEELIPEQNVQQVQIEQPVQSSQPTQTFETQNPQFTAASENQNETTQQVSVNQQSLNVESQAEGQSENVQKNIQVPQNQTAQSVSYTAVRQTPQQQVFEQQPMQPAENQVNAENNGSVLLQTQSQPVNQNQQTQLTQPAQQAEIVEIPQTQVAAAEAQSNTQQNNNQQNLNNFVNTDSELNDNSQSVLPNQNAQQNQNQQNQQQQNLNANVQNNVKAEISTEESNNQAPTESFTTHLGIATNNVNNSQQPTAASQVDQPQQATSTMQDEFNITGQIVEHAKMIRTAQNTEMVIHLKPEHLGELTLKVSVTSNGSVNASFHSDNAAVRAMIENTIVHLKNELSNQGLKVESVQVYSGLDGNLMNGRGQQAWQQNQQGNNAQQSKRINGVSKLNGRSAETAVEAAVSTTPVNNSMSADGVDYRV